MYSLERFVTYYIHEYEKSELIWAILNHICGKKDSTLRGYLYFCV